MTNKKNLLLAAFLVTAMSGITACSDDGSGTTSSSNQCTTSDDCKNGGICIDGVCKSDTPKKDCSSSDDCNKGESCINGSCQSNSSQKQCISVQDCAADELCKKGTCQKMENPSQALKDTDGDTIPDAYDSCDEDTDGDTIPNCEDLDSDNDTIPDSIESGNDGDPSLEPVDSDFDDIYDFLSPDSDSNGIPDSLEAGSNPNHPVDTDNDTIPDYRSDDNDGDGVSDIDEIQGLKATDAQGNSHYGRKCGDSWCEAGDANHPWDADGDTIPDYIDKDSDGDTIPDEIEGIRDSDGDGILDRYDLDSDNDTIPDAEEINPDGTPITATTPSGKVNYCFQNADCDGDGMIDTIEIKCPGNTTPGNDQDNDGFTDAAEYYAALYAMEHGLLSGQKISSIEDLVCNPALGVKDVFEFHFDLPYQGDQKDDLLIFLPSVKKLDLVFNVDTTSSMENAINNVKTNIGNVINKVRSIVPDTGFGLTNFDDYPVGDCHMYDDSMTLSVTDPTGNVTQYPGSSLYTPCGIDSFQNLQIGDRPFRLLGTISTDTATITSYTQNPLFTTRHGADGAESGVESLYRIATGSSISWNAGSLNGPFYPQFFTNLPLFFDFPWQAGSIPAQVNAPNTWGGVDFRMNTLPIVIHTTDVYSHDKADPIYNSYFPSILSYPSSVNNPHSTAELIPALQQKGIRVITLNVTSQHANEYSADIFGQMTTWSRESNAVVPACAFDCAGKCCLGDEISDPITINNRSNQCILAYKANMSDVSDTVVKGVDALVKYGTYQVATRIRGEAIEGSSVDTSCFIKQVVATEYIAPPQEPEHSCNPVATPTEVDNAGYNNGFDNFAPGTSNPNVKGSELHFTVIAQNENCVKPTSSAQFFTAYIDVYDPTTGVSFGERKVSIIVPPAGIISIN